ncbi:MAG: hypothetical protein Q9166_003572 [cf. Caloplaca sp. 2 TL-2023]
MVTGVETAGLVLAALPLIIKGLQHYNEGLKPLKDFVQYQEKRQELATNLALERRQLLSTCEKLLTGIVDSEVDLAFLLQDPGSGDWKQPSLANRLQERLQDSYAVYFSVVQELAQAITTLANKIGLDTQGQYQWTDTRSHKKYWKRFATCLDRKEHEALLARISRDNQSLRNLTDDTLTLELIRSRRQSRKTSFKLIRDLAARLHNALRSRLLCGCSVAHCANLQLESRDWDQPPSFRVTFPLHSSSSGMTWHETDIKISLKPDVVADTPKSTAISPVIDADPVIVKDPFLETISSSSAIRGGLVSSFQRLKITEKKRVAWAIVPGVQAANLPLAALLDAQRKGKSLEDKSNRLAVKEEKSIDDLCSSLRSTETEPARSCIGKFTDEQHHYEVLAVSRHQDSSIHTSDLHDLLGRHQTFLSTTSVNHSAIFRAPVIGLTRKARLQLAVTLASTALQLHTTPWLDADWNSKSIHFRQESIEHPYISSTFPKTHKLDKEDAKPTFTPIRNQCLFSLGVLLTEVYLGRPLDCHEDPKRPFQTEDFSKVAAFVERLAQEEGTGYCDALKACIWCDFGVRELDMENDSFRRAIYERVVVPLEQELDYYCRRQK